MTSITSKMSRVRLAGVAAVAVALSVVYASGIVATKSVSAQAVTVTVQKQIVVPSTVAGTFLTATGDLSGYVFTLNGGSGAITLPATNAAGQTAIQIAPGTYTISEQPRPGTTLQGFSLTAFTGTTVTPAALSPSIGNFAVSTTPITIFATNQVAGTGSITITKQIVDAANAVVATADLSGFTFNITGPAGFTPTALVTPATGIVSLSNLAPGNYSITEAPRPGFTFVAAAVNGIPVPNGQQFPIAAGQPITALFQNRQGTATGSVTITKQLVDATGAAVTTDRSGFTFTVSCGATSTTAATFTQTGTTDVNGTATIANVPAGSCTINEAARAGFTLASIIPTTGTVDIGNNGAITVTAGQATNITVRNNVTATTAQTDPVQLVQGCNNVSLTFAAGTPLATVAAAIVPTANLISIFRFDNIQGRFFGFSPIAPASVNDYTSVQVILEPVFICMSGPGTLNRPRI